MTVKTVASYFIDNHRGHWRTRPHDTLRCNGDSVLANGCTAEIPPNEPWLNTGIVDTDGKWLVLCSKCAYGDYDE